MALLTDLENTGNEGPICADAIAQLTANGIPIHSPSRMPKPLIHQEILNFSRFISMSKAEHKPMVDQKWPGTFPYMEYWEIGDIGTDAPEDAFLKICQGVEQLIHELLQENC